MTAEEWSALSDTTWKMQSLIHITFRALLHVRQIV